MRPFAVTLVVCFYLSFSAGSINDQVINVLIARIEALEEKGGVLMKELEVQKQTTETELSKLQLRIAILEKENAVLNKANVQLRRSSKKQKSALKILKQIIGRKDLELGVHRPEVTGNRSDSNDTYEYSTEAARKIFQKDVPDKDILQSSLGSLPRRFVDGLDGPVAFHATLSVGSIAHIGLGQNIVFRNVIQNIGNSYHSNHGIFIAPQQGAYLFSTSVLAHDSNGHPQIIASIIKDGEVLAKAYGYAENGHYDQGSVTVVTHLNAGDEVWVESSLIPDNTLYGGSYTSFMGYKIPY